MGNKDFSFIPGLDDDERILLRNILDKYDKSQEIYKPLFTFFLDERKISLAKTVLASQKAEGFKFFGGFEGAQRCVLCLRPEHLAGEDVAFPIKPVTFTYRAVDKLSHRDILGALMSLDIKRECIGDIIVGEGKSCTFVYETVADDVLSVSRIGKVGIKVKEGFDETIVSQVSFKEISSTVSSLRIDGVVSAACGVSRDKASSLIKSSLVSLDQKCVTSASQKIDIGGVFSVRGHGKFQLVSCRDTKKGRINIVIKKYL